MNHRKSLKKLNRTSAHRIAMLINMSNSLIEHGKIKTTLPKAKMLRPYVEKIITLGKRDDHHSRMLFLSKQNHNIKCMSIVFNELSKRFKDRPGGYTRITKCGFRYGDMAPMAVIELV